MIKEESGKLIAKLQGLPTDPVGFGKKLRIAYPGSGRPLIGKEFTRRPKLP